MIIQQSIMYYVSTKGKFVKINFLSPALIILLIMFNFLFVLFFSRQISAQPFAGTGEIRNINVGSEGACGLVGKYYQPYVAAVQQSKWKLMCGRFVNVTFGLGCLIDYSQNGGCNGIPTSDQWKGKVAILEVNSFFWDSDQRKFNDIQITNQLSTNFGILQQSFVKVVWEFVRNPNTSEATRIYYKSESTQHWCQIFLTGLPNGLSMIQQKLGQNWQNSTLDWGQFYPLKCQPTITELQLKLYDADGVLYTPEVIIQAPNNVQEREEGGHFLAKTIQLLLPNVLSSNENQTSVPLSSANSTNSVSSPDSQIILITNSTATISLSPSNTSTPINDTLPSTTSNLSYTSNEDENTKSSSSDTIDESQINPTSSSTEVIKSSTQIQNQSVSITSSSESIQVNNSANAQSTISTNTNQSSEKSSAQLQSKNTSTQVKSSALASNTTSTESKLGGHTIQSQQLVSSTQSPSQDLSNVTTSQPSYKKTSKLSFTTTSKISSNESSSNCSSICIPNDLCHTEFKHTICICDPNTTLDYSISLIRLQWCNPIIRIKFNHPLLRKLSIQTQSLNFSFSTTQNESEGLVDVELLALTPQQSSCINIKILGRQGGKSQMLTIPYTFQPKDLGSQRTLRWLQVLRNVSYKLSRDEVKIMSYFGMFSLLQKSSQALAQLIFLNSTDPLLVYEFERIIAIWTLDKSFPDWEDIYNNHTVQLYTTMKVYETKNEQLLEAGLFKYSRAGISQYMFLNLEENLIIGVFLLVTLYLVNSFRKAQQTPLQVQRDLHKLATQIECSNEKITGLDNLIETISVQSKLDQLIVFAFLSMSLESKLCLYIHSIYLTLGYPNFHEIMGFCNILFCLLFIVVYTGYHLMVVYQIRQLLMIKKNIESSTILQAAQRTLLIYYLEGHLSNKYRFFLLDKKLNNSWTIYATFAFIIKKWIFGVTIVCLYGKVVVQIGLLITIHLLEMIYRLVIRPYKSVLINLLNIIGNRLFIIVLVLKLCDFTRYSELVEQAIDIQKFKKWQDQGLYTMIMEMCYLLLYMVVFLTRIVIYMIERPKIQKILKQNNAYLREIVSMTRDPAIEFQIFYDRENSQQNHLNQSDSSNPNIEMSHQQPMKNEKNESFQQQEELCQNVELIVDIKSNYIRTHLGQNFHILLRTNEANSRKQSNNYNDY